MSQSKTPNDIEAFIHRTDIETQHLRTKSPASTVFIPHITLLPGKNYTTPKKYEEAMSKAFLEKNQHHLQEEITAEVVPSYQDLDQRLTTVENMLGLKKEKKEEEEKPPTCLQDVCIALGVVLFTWGFTFGLIILVMKVK